MARFFFDKSVKIAGLIFPKKVVFNTLRGKELTPEQCVRLLMNPMQNNILFRTMSAKEAEAGPRLGPKSDAPLGLRSNGNAVQFNKDGTINYNKTCDQYYRHHSEQSFLTSFSFTPTIYSLIAIATGKSQVRIVDHTAIHPLFKMTAHEASTNLSDPNKLKLGEGGSATYLYEMERSTQDPSHLTCAGCLFRDGTSILFEPNPYFIDLTDPNLPIEVRDITERAVAAFTLANMIERDPSLVTDGKVPAVSIRDAQILAWAAVSMYKDYHLQSGMIPTNEKEGVEKLLASAREQSGPAIPDTSRFEVIEEQLDAARPKSPDEDVESSAPQTSPRM